MLVAFLAIASLSRRSASLATIQNVDGWYADAEKAPWSPPNWIFGPVWTLLYTRWRSRPGWCGGERNEVEVRRRSRSTSSSSC